MLNKSICFSLIFKGLIYYELTNIVLYRLGHVAQSVTCLATDECLTSDPGVASLILARSHTFMEIDHDLISTVILLPSADAFKKVCCQLQAKYVHEVLVYHFFKLAQEKVWLGELTAMPWPKILNWDVKQQNKQNILYR